ncbi:hypothetical protein BGZ76_003821 [Entomortierella beljakovae]|nr:hypothetical protein BGZ76_003821 [Entomortierella beljakovae]
MPYVGGRPKSEREHYLKFHSDIPVRLESTIPGKIYEYSRNPAVDMMFQCCCGTTFSPRTSAANHLRQCDIARFATVGSYPGHRGFRVLDAAEMEQGNNSIDSIYGKTKVRKLADDDDNNMSRLEIQHHTQDTIVPAVNASARRSAINSEESILRGSAYNILGLNASANATAEYRQL